MRFSLFVIILFFVYFLPNHLIGQRIKEPEFAEALILTKAGDTLLCFVSMQVQHQDRVEYRRDLNSESEVMAAEDIRMVVTTSRVLESVIVEDHEELMTLLLSGRTNLYNSVSITDPTYNAHQGAYGSQSTSVSYVVKKNGSYHTVKRVSFRNDVSNLFSDCPTVVQKVAAKEYRFMDMEAIVREYNDCGSK